MMSALAASRRRSSAIVAKRAELFASVELASEIEALKEQLALVTGAPRPPTPIRRPFCDHLIAEKNPARQETSGVRYEGGPGGPVEANRRVAL